MAWKAQSLNGNFENQRHLRSSLGAGHVAASADAAVGLRYVGGQSFIETTEVRKVRFLATVCVICEIYLVM